MKKHFAALVLCFLMLSGVLPARGDALSDQRLYVTELAGEILARQMQAAGASSEQAWLDGGLSRSIGSSEWYVFALSQRGDLDFTRWREAMAAYLSEKPVRSAVTRLKIALTLLAAGGSEPYIAATLADSAGQQGLMSHVFALHLLNNGVESEGLSAENTIRMLLSLQKQDGGWVLTGNVSDPDVTAMTLQALALHRGDEAVSAAIDRALMLLSELQRPDGGYASYGVPNPESASQVLIALCELGIDGLADPRFIKDGATLLDGITAYRVAEGSYAHRLGDQANPNATMQALLAFTAYERLTSGRSGMFTLDQDRSADNTETPDIYSGPHNLPLVFGGKTIAVSVILLVAGFAVLILCLTGRRSRRNLAAVAIIAAGLAAFVCLTDFESADSYYSGQAPVKKDVVGYVTLSIRCDTVAGRAAHIPADGEILAPTRFPIAQGDTVFAVLTDAARACGLHVESSGAAGMRYVSGLGNLHEYDYGDLSGWLYYVNGESPGMGCEQLSLSDGDVIEWHYTCDMGGDIGR